MRQLKVIKSISFTPACITTPPRPADFRGGSAFFLRNMPDIDTLSTVNNSVNKFKSVLMVCVQTLFKLSLYLPLTIKNPGEFAATQGKYFENKKL